MAVGPLRIKDFMNVLDPSRDDEALEFCDSTYRLPKGEG